MKKIYNTPHLKVVMLNGADIIATSKDYRTSNYGGYDNGDGEGD